MLTRPEAPSRCARLRSLLQSSRLEFLMEAHNGLSAHIAEEAGFPGIWASGLGIAAQFGVRDSNEASWTQVVLTAEFMADATTVPILLDGDTGYGNFNNMRRLVRKLEQRGIAGVCIEDKLFPKANSFQEGQPQPLADVDEFCGKIQAGKDSQQDPDFCIVARVEAFIAGWGLDEALRRAEAYRRAGADAILIHSKSTRPDEVLAFAREWAGRHPLVIVPTRYYSTPAAVFRAAGISVVIWANPLVRASIAAMQAVAREVRETETLVRVEDRIAPLDEVFRLQGADELAEAHRLYLSPREARASAVVLAATRGEGLDALTAQRPKGMLPVGGKPLLRRLVDELRRQGIPDVTVVAGWHPEAVDIPGSRTVVNDAHATSGELVSLASAEAGLREDAVVVYGDLLFRSYVLRDLLESDAPVTVVVDSAPAVGGVADHAWCTAPDDRAVFPREVRLLRIASSPGDAPPAGRWIGMARFQGPGRHWLRSALDELRQRSDFERLDVPDLLNHLVQRGDPVRVQFIHGHWLDVNTLEDLGRADAFTQPEGV